MCNQFAGLKRVLNVRSISGELVEFGEGDRALAFRALDENRRFQGRHSHAHVRRMRRDAMLAGAQDGVCTMKSVHRRAAGARRALVAAITARRARVGLAEVDGTPVTLSSRW